MNNGNNSGRRHTIPYVIVAVLVVPLCIAGAVLNNTDQVIPERLKNGFPLYFFGAFAIVGLGMVTDAIATLIYRVKHCKYVTDAVCVGLESKVTSGSDGHRKTLYSPVYGFEYNGEEHTIRNHLYRGRSYVPEVGFRSTLNVDVDNFSDYYVGSPAKGLVARIIWGLIFSAPALAILIGVLLQGLGML